MSNAEDVDARVRRIMRPYEDAGLLESGIFATAANWQALLSNPHAGRVGLVGFYKSRIPIDKNADAGEAILKLGNDPHYDKVVDDLHVKYGAKHVYFAMSMCVWVDTDEVDWDFFSISEFPNREAMVGFMMEPAWIEVCKTRVRVLERHRTYAVRLPDSGMFLH